MLLLVRLWWFIGKWRLRRWCCPRGHGWTKKQVQRDGQHREPCRGVRRQAGGAGRQVVRNVRLDKPLQGSSAIIHEVAAPQQHTSVDPGVIRIASAAANSLHSTAYELAPTRSPRAVDMREGIKQHEEIPVRGATSVVASRGKVQDVRTHEAWREIDPAILPKVSEGGQEGSSGKICAVASAVREPDSAAGCGQTARLAEGAAQWGQVKPMSLL